MYARVASVKVTVEPPATVTPLPREPRPAPRARAPPNVPRPCPARAVQRAPYAWRPHPARPTRVLRGD